MKQAKKSPRKTKRKPARPRRLAPLSPAAQAVCARIKKIWEQRKSEDPKDYSFVTVSSWADISPGHFSEIINGKIPPGVETLDKLAQALDVTMADLVAIDDTPQAKLLDLARQLSDSQISRVLKTGYALLPGEMPALPMAAESSTPIKR